MSSASKLLKHAGNHRRWIALAAAFGIITIGAGISLMGVAAYLLTRSAFGGAAVTLSLVILAVRVSATSRVVARYLDRYIGHLGTFSVLTRLRVWLYRSLINSDTPLLLEQNRGDIVAALVDDVETMQDHLLRVAVPPIVAFGALSIGALAVGAIHPLFAIVLITSFTVAGTLIPWANAKLTTASASRLVDLHAERMSIATEGFDALRELQRWGSTDLIVGAMNALEHETSRLHRRLTKAKAITDAATIVVVGLCAISLIAIASQLALSDGKRWWIASVPLIAMATFEALAPLVLSRSAAGRTNAAAKRLLAIEANTHSDLASPSNLSVPDNTTIAFDKVGFRYRSGPLILDSVSFIIPSGSTCLFIAETGEGKSTIASLLLGLAQPDTGLVTIGGIESRRVSRINPTTDVTSLAAVLQDDHLFDTSVRDNLLVADGDATDVVLQRACVIAGLESFLHDRPGGFDAGVGPNGELLSGGERQRVMIARAIVADAPILVLDEATEHLEPARRRDIIDAVLRSRQGRTTIVFSHDPDVAEQADVVFTLSNGQVSAA